MSNKNAREVSICVSSEKEISQHISACIPQGNAVDILVSSLLLAAMRSPEVFLGSLQIMVSGPGVGAHAIDGRVVQPGLGAKRPRGFVEGESIPDAARIGISRFSSALLVLLTSFGTLTLRQAFEPAKIYGSSSKERAMFLNSWVKQGSFVFLEPPFFDAFMDAAGILEGGLCTKQDLEETVPHIISLQRELSEESEVLSLPWGSYSERANDTEAIVVTDGMGLVALATYEKRAGKLLEPVGLTLPYHASPVRRGMTRVKPGTPCEVPSHMAIVRSKSGDVPAAQVALAHAHGVSKEERWTSLVSQLEGETSLWSSDRLLHLANEFRATQEKEDSLGNLPPVLLGVFESDSRLNTI